MNWTAWLKSTAEYLKTNWGLSAAFSQQAAVLLAYFFSYNLNPRITSGFRDPKKQAAMREAWDAGQRAGLRARPAASSKHSTQNWLGAPAAEAIDIVTNNETMAAQIARALKIGDGLAFGDPGHYFLQ
jgi:hypothetical protein